MFILVNCHNLKQNEGQRACADAGISDVTDYAPHPVSQKCHIALCWLLKQFQWPSDSDGQSPLKDDRRVFPLSKPSVLNAPRRSMPSVSQWQPGVGALALCLRRAGTDV